MMTDLLHLAKHLTPSGGIAAADVARTCGVSLYGAGQDSCMASGLMSSLSALQDRSSLMAVAAATGGQRPWGS